MDAARQLHVYIAPLTPAHARMNVAPHAHCQLHAWSSRTRARRAQFYALHTDAGQRAPRGAVTEQRSALARAPAHLRGRCSRRGHLGQAQARARGQPSVPARPCVPMVAARAAAVRAVVSACMLPALCSPGASVHSRGSARKHPRRRKPHGHTLTRSAPGGHTQQRGERHARQARVRAVLVGWRGGIGGRRAARQCRASVIPRAPCGLRSHTVMQRSLRMLHARRSLPAGSRPSAHTASRPSRMSHTPACASGARCGAMHVAARRAARPAIDREQAQRTRERAPLTPRSRCIGRFLAVCMCTPTGIFARGRAAASVAAPSCARLLRPAQGQLLTCERVSPCGPACASQAC